MVRGDMVDRLGGRGYDHAAEAILVECVVDVTVTVAVEARVRVKVR